MHSVRNRRATARPVVKAPIIKAPIIKAREQAPAALQPWTPFLRHEDFPPRFPSGLVRPQPLGAAITTMPWPAAPAPALKAEAIKEKPATAKRKRATKVKLAKKPKLKTKAKVKTTAKTAPKVRKPAKLRAIALPEPALALPKESEPLVSAVPAPDDRTPPPRSADLPRSAALAPYRKGGFLALISFWLRDTGRWLARGSAKPRGKPKPAARKTAPTPPAPRPNEMALLRAENERLRLQLEAMMAMRAGGEALKVQAKTSAAVL